MGASPVDKITKHLTERGGWRLGTSLENRAAYRLSRWGWTPQTVEQQHKIGPYRADFAWPEVRVVLEMDGWHHRSPKGAARDAERDAYMRANGWLVFRVDDQTEVDTQLLRVHEVVQLLKGMR